MSSSSILAGLALESTAEQEVAASEEVVALLQAVLSRLGYPDQASGSLRVLITSGTVNTVTTVTTVTTVGTVSNITNVGGLSAIYDQHAQMAMTNASAIRNQISVS